MWPVRVEENLGSHWILHRERRSRWGTPVSFDVLLLMVPIVFSRHIL